MYFDNATRTKETLAVPRAFQEMHVKNRIGLGIRCDDRLLERRIFGFQSSTLRQPIGLI